MVAQMLSIASIVSYYLPLSTYVWAIQQLAFHAAGLAFEWCDRQGVLQHLKPRAGRRKRYDSYQHQLPRVLFNQLFILLPCMMAAEKLGLCFTGPAKLSRVRFLLSMPIMAIGHDIIQYTTHRYLLHWPNVWLMRLLRHSVHHSTSATTGISACYMTGADFFLEIVLPYLIPLALVGGGGSDFSFHALVAGLGAFGGVYEHSGYDFAELLRTARTSVENPKPMTELDNAEYMGSSFTIPPRIRLAVISFLQDQLTSRAHAEHHSRSAVSFSDGFGSPGICDSLFGTRWDMVLKRNEAEDEWKTQQKQLGDSEQK